jgi:hypothetical protein
LRITAVLLACLALAGALPAQTSGHSFQLLLTPKRLRRLQRDRERQTDRWVNFETRIESVADSRERGWELALYYAVTHDQARGREAIQWAIAHRCEQRQVALVLDWVSELIGEDDRQKLAAHTCFDSGMRSTPFVQSSRNALFQQIARGENASEAGDWKAIVTVLERGQFRDPEALYAACELLLAVRTTEHVDLRENAAGFFSILPSEFLLSLRPEDVQHPNWMAHVAALALVGLDPNMTGSQYLQGWAMEEQQTVREGPGVAYELLWADPYLPGIGYQNLDPWVYDPIGRLFARNSWDVNACWIGISSKGVEEEHCPPGWRNRVNSFGHMTLIPMTQECVQVPDRGNDNAAVIWQLPARQAIRFASGKQQESAQADAAGMWRLPANAGGKICVANAASRR